jgi:hypothetical protein
VKITNQTSGPNKIGQASKLSAFITQTSWVACSQFSQRIILPALGLANTRESLSMLKVQNHDLYLQQPEEV